MRKINLKDYTIKVKAPDKLKPGRVIEGEYPYHVKDSILTVMFCRDLQLSGAELVKQNVLAMKLEACKDDEIILEDEEWGRLVKATNTFHGFGRNDVELVTRILEAEEVEVEPKKTK